MMILRNTALIACTLFIFLLSACMGKTANPIRVDRTIDLRADPPGRVYNVSFELDIEVAEGDYTAAIRFVNPLDRPVCFARGEMPVHNAFDGNAIEILADSETVAPIDYQPISSVDDEGHYDTAYRIAPGGDLIQRVPLSRDYDLPSDFGTMRFEMLASGYVCESDVVHFQHADHVLANSNRVEIDRQADGTLNVRRVPPLNTISMTNYIAPAQLEVANGDGRLIATVTYRNSLDRDVCFEPGGWPQDGSLMHQRFFIRTDIYTGSGDDIISYNGPQEFIATGDRPIDEAFRIPAGDAAVARVVLNDYFDIPAYGPDLVAEFNAQGFVCGTDQPNILYAEQVNVLSEQVIIPR